MTSLLVLLAACNMGIITILLVVKSFHYVLTKSQASFDTYLYCDIRRVIATEHPRVVAQKRFQNRMSSALVFFIVLQLVFCMMYIFLAK